MENVGVSICCVTFNHVVYIRKCLDSFLMQQTKFPIEILVHDDASTDGTSEIIREYAAKYPDVIKPIIQTENQYSKGVRGMNVRFNFTRAKGKYLATCEGDDYWTDPHKLQKQFDFLEANPEYVAVHHDFVTHDEHDNPVSGFYNFNYKKDYTSKEMALGAFMKFNTMFFRNIGVEQMREFPLITNGDKYLIALLAFHGKAKYLPEIAPSVYTIHSGGVWSLKDNAQRFRYLIETYEHIQKLHPKYRNDYRQLIFNNRLQLFKSIKNNLSFWDQIKWKSKLLIESGFSISNMYRVARS